MLTYTFNSIKLAYGSSVLMTTAFGVIMYIVYDVYKMLPIQTHLMQVGCEHFEWMMSSRNNIMAAIVQIAHGDRFLIEGEKTNSLAWMKAPSTLSKLWIDKMNDMSEILNQT